MVTQVHTPSAISKIDNKSKVVTHPALIEIGTEEALRFRLTNILQTTLELDLLLQLFYEYVSKCTHIDGVSYHFSEKGISIAVGKKGRHQCSYRLSSGGDFYGEILLTRNKRFAEEEIVGLENYLAVLIYPLRNALSYRDALQTAATDSLTGLGNRAALDSAISREISTAQRYQQPFSILVVDIDHFKSINDRFGHPIGDAVLRAVGHALAETSRTSDAVFRYGGEEFVLLLTKTNSAGAAIIAERIRDYIANLNLDYLCETKTNFKLSTSISVGLATLAAGDDKSSLFKRADKALYDAKKGGRNKVVNGDIAQNP